MANSNQASKRVRQANRSRVHNVPHLTRYRTHLKRARVATLKGSLEEARKEAELFVAIADHVSGMGLIPYGRAARHKSRLAILMRKAGAPRLQARRPQPAPAADTAAKP